MTNVQEALKVAIQLIERNLTGYAEHPDFTVLNQCKSALAEIEKCEPVAEAIRERDRLGFAVVNVIGKLDEIIDATQEVEIDDFLHIAVPIDMWNELQAALEDMPKRADLYTSPQPRECEPVAYMNPNAKDTLSMLHWAKSEYYSQPLYAFQTISNVEPIVWMTNREDVIEQFGTMTITNAHKNSLVLAEQIIADLFDIPLYTLPQPREWVGLTYKDKVDLRENNDWYNFPNDLIEATEAKCKQLNTKG